MAIQTATFGAGCFWGVEVTFRNVDGVIDAAVGYCGGDVDNATYEQVCTGTTGHAEVVQLTFDDTKVSFQALVDLFFTMHDPTTLNRQGPDKGTQYRSAIFYHSDEQKQTAEATVQRLTDERAFRNSIVTTVEPEQPFWRAEEYHQQYLSKRGLASCHV